MGRIEWALLITGAAVALGVAAVAALPPASAVREDPHAPPIELSLEEIAVQAAWAEENRVDWAGAPNAPMPESAKVRTGIGAVERYCAGSPSADNRVHCADFLNRERQRLVGIELAERDLTVGALDEPL